MVIGLGARSVVIRTVDGQTVHLPNSEVLREPLMNNSAFGRRRSEIEARYRVDGSVADELAALRTAVAAAPGVLVEPGPEAVVHALEVERLTARVRFWHDPLQRAAVVAAATLALGEYLRGRNLEATVVSSSPDDPTAPPAPV